MMVMRLAPIGVFCLIAKTFAGLGFSAMVPMFKYMGAVLLALFIQCCGVYQVLLALFTRLNRCASSRSLLRLWASPSRRLLPMRRSR